MDVRLVGCCALWLLVAVNANCHAQRLPERDPRTRSDDADSMIREAIERQQADPQVTRVAEASLRSLIRWERMLGLKFGPAQLEKFMNGKGGDVKYGPTTPIANWTREHEGAQYSHRAAHENASNRIRKWIEEEVRGGRTSFPARIPLDSIGFVKNYVDKNTPGYKDRLQGPTLYQSGMVFQVPVPYLEAPASVVELTISFGDMQGPHEGMINNLRVEVIEKDGKKTVNYDYEITYTWNDQYTFDNDTDMSHYDAAAHYLEFIAKTARSYKTSVLMKEKVRGSSELTSSESDPSGDNGSGGSNPGAGNPGNGNPGSDPSSGDGTPVGPGKGGSAKLPPMNIPHPPGWGVKGK